MNHEVLTEQYLDAAIFYVAFKVPIENALGLLAKDLAQHHIGLPFRL